MPIRNSLSDVKGLTEIRTRTGQVVNSGVPYIAYLKISCLEMEKARREKEKRAAEARIANINARLAEIEAEKDAILRRQGERALSLEAAPAKLKKPVCRTQPTLTNGCFKIRY